MDNVDIIKNILYGLLFSIFLLIWLIGSVLGGWIGVALALVGLSGAYVMGVNA